jgi:hypothetical protein
MLLERLLRSRDATEKLNKLTPNARALLDMRLLHAFLQPNYEFEVIEVITTVQFGRPIDIVTLNLGGIAVALAFGRGGRMALLDFDIIDEEFERPPQPLSPN